MERRTFLRLGWTALGAAAALLGVRLAPFVAAPPGGEEPLRIRLGRPAEYQTPGIHPVSGGKFFLLWDGKTFQALSSRCTHLGCRVRYDGDHNQFFCPCHGSRYDGEGRPVNGPAPKPLERFGVEIDPDGYLVVDRSQRTAQGGDPHGAIR